MPFLKVAIRSSLPPCIPYLPCLPFFTFTFTFPSLPFPSLLFLFLTTLLRSPSLSSIGESGPVEGCL